LKTSPEAAWNAMLCRWATPKNEYEISMSRRTPFLFLMKVISPYSPNITINQFPILLLMSIILRHNKLKYVCILYTVYCVFLSQLIYLEACMCIFLALLLELFCRGVIIFWPAEQ
jgi:hypothetical protein